jgi:hypothetical protein
MEFNSGAGLSILFELIYCSKAGMSLVSAIEAENVTHSCEDAKNTKLWAHSARCSVL